MQAPRARMSQSEPNLKSQRHGHFLERQTHACFDRSVRPEPGISHGLGSGVGGVDKTLPVVPTTWPVLPQTPAPRLPKRPSSQRLPQSPLSSCFPFPPSPDGLPQVPVLLCEIRGARRVSGFTETQIIERSSGIKCHLT